MPAAQPLNDYDVNRVFLKNVDYLMGAARALAAKPCIDHDDVDILAQVFDGKPAIKDHPVLREIALLLQPSQAKTLLTQPGLDSLHERLRALCGIGGDGMPAGPTAILFEDEEEPIDFDGMVFCFTGTFKFGTRLKCAQAVDDLGGEVRDNVTVDTDYLVVGSKVTPTWRHDTFGGKITKAKQWQDQGTSSIEIVSEERWRKSFASHSGLQPSVPPSAAGASPNIKKSPFTPHKEQSKTNDNPQPGKDEPTWSKGHGTTAGNGKMMWEFNIDIRPTRLLLYFLVMMLLTTVFAVGWKMA